MATNFYSGLATGLNQAEERMRADERLRMDRERALNTELQQEVSNQRADETFAMQKEDNARRAALSDFQFSEAQRKAAEEKEIKEGFKSLHQTHFGPRKVKDADGNEVDFTPDANDPKLVSAHIADTTRFMASKGLLRPADQKILLETQQWIKKTGVKDAFTELIATGGLSENSRAQVAPMLGLDPAQPVSVKVDASGPFKRTFVNGTRADGTPFQQEATWIAAALGLPDMDPDKQSVERAKSLAALNKDVAIAGAQRSAGRASEARAGYYDRSAGAGVRTQRPVDPDKVSEDFLREIKTAKFGFDSNVIGMLPADAKTDDFKTKWVQETGLGMMRSGVLNPQTDRPFKPRELTQFLSDRYDTFQNQAVAGTKWVKDEKTKKWRQATPEDKKPKSFGDIDFAEKLKIREELFRQFEAQRRQAADQRRRQTQGRAAALPKDEDDDEE